MAYVSREGKFRPEEDEKLRKLMRPEETWRQFVLRLAGLNVDPILRGRPPLKLNKGTGFYERVKCDSCDKTEAEGDGMIPSHSLDGEAGTDHHEVQGLEGIFEDPLKRRRETGR